MPKVSCWLPSTPPLEPRLRLARRLIDSLWKISSDGRRPTRCTPQLHGWRSTQHDAYHSLLSRGYWPTRASAHHNNITEPLSILRQSYPVTEHATRGLEPLILLWHTPPREAGSVFRIHHVLPPLNSPAK
ncbi:hypothetical protein T440DRAFT_195814 [Plenodomus tracheiphilus IPT5]|uniref:Uncharacterized protein n=1 Tax=Plenodomus tracheiphilus IPT5 TaxID=1408161 RepID=A0A6A7AVS5_9PLEO|nr:hypothetical protein T440DRAFT_195814 [Plenodomus tracheiphilus IPT5]